jgi:large subunit ribosomal protein L23
MNLTKIIVKPIITEKALQIAAEENSYTFSVQKQANKNQIKKAVESQFNVSVVGVRTINKKGKIKRRGVTRRSPTKVPAGKKAFVKLKEGDKIKLFEIGG